MMSEMKYKILFTITALGLSACGPVDGNNAENNGPSGDCVALENEAINGGASLSGCYTVASTLTVNDGVLTIEAGTELTFAQDVGFEVGANAGLVIAGTAEAPVTFKGLEQERGYWKGLRFNDSDSPQNSISHLTLTHAGSSAWTGDPASSGGIYISGENNNLEISDSTFSENAAVAVHAQGGDSDVTIASSSFTNNDASLWLHANLTGGLSDDLTFEGNDDGHIHTSINGASESVSREQTWPALTEPYLVRRTIKLDALLTLSPGSRLEFEQDVGIDISDEGRLSAVGTEASPITFTGAEEERGFWKGLYYHDTRSSQNVLEHVAITHAGSDGWTGGAQSRGCIYIAGDGVALKIASADFQECAQAAIVAEASGVDFSLEGSSFTANELPLWIHANLAGSLAADNTMSGNDDDYILLGVNGASTEVSANQTWNTFDVPYRADRTVLVSGELTLSPGLIFEFDQDTGVQVNGGNLIADASSGDRIQFIPADGETLSGFWKGIHFIDSFSSSNTIANADILYGGSSGWTGGEQSIAGLYISGGSNKAQVSLDDVRIAGSGRWGVSIDEEGAISPCAAVTLEDNGSGSEGGDLRVEEGGTFACN